MVFKKIFMYNFIIKFAKLYRQSIKDCLFLYIDLTLYILYVILHIRVIITQNKLKCKGEKKWKKLKQKDLSK